jgi:hypothetical protein
MGLKQYQSMGFPLRMSRWNLFSHFIQPPFCTLRITVEHYNTKKVVFFFLLVSSKNHFLQHANGRNYTSSSSWHAAIVLIQLVGMR